MSIQVAVRPSSITGCMTEWSEREVDNVIRSDSESGNIKTRRRFSGIGRLVNCSVTLDAKHYQDFMDWWNVSQGQGAYATWVRTPYGTDEIFQWIAPPTISWRGANNRAFTAQVEMYQSPAMRLGSGITPQTVTPNPGTVTVPNLPPTGMSGLAVNPLPADAAGWLHNDGRGHLDWLPLPSGTGTSGGTTTVPVHDHDTRYYLKSQFIARSTGPTSAALPIVTNPDGKIDESLYEAVSVSTGPSDAGKLIQLTGTGRIDPSLFHIQAMTFLGVVDPASLPPNPGLGDFVVFNANGTVNGNPVANHDLAIWDGTEWDVIPNELDLNHFLMLDGSKPMAGALNMDSNPIHNVPNPSANGDAVNLVTLKNNTFWKQGAHAGLIHYSTGNVGIGTDAPGAPLHIIQPNHTGPALILENGSAGANNRYDLQVVLDYGQSAQQITSVGSGAGIRWDDFGRNVSIWTGDLAEQRLTVASDGNVGIGTGQPIRKLEVNAKSSNEIARFLCDTGTWGLLEISNGNTTWNIGTASGQGVFALRESGVNLLTVYPSGVNGGAVRMDSLTGTGTEMVVATATGQLMRQAIPTGGSSAPSTVSWSQITNAPVLFSGAYSDLSGKPAIIPDAPDTAWSYTRPKGSWTATPTFNNEVTIKTPTSLGTASLTLQGGRTGSGTAYAKIDFINDTATEASLVARKDGQVILNPGHLGIGVAPAEALHVDGAILATDDITAFYSDDRLKTGKLELSGALERIAQLNAFTYYPNQLAIELGAARRSDDRRVGVSAQDVEQVLPEAVSLAPFDTEKVGGVTRSKSGENYKTVDYAKLVPLLIAAVQELSARVEELEK